MKQLLAKLRETIESDINDIQFRIKDNYYELIRNRKGEWELITLVGKDLNLNTKGLKGLRRNDVETLLKNRYNNIDIY